ncbi:MAG: phosphonate metabolism transcriptional regulator PhnF [Minwuia sp.]|uniref:phosphonate metabolism transcriptional regulator PhnF n=1 Tax=Minwuia sp. TaxID=2493630 RepID=UPI003A8A7305
MRDRRGVALWRQIADRIRDDLPIWQRERGGQLPTEAELSRRFAVNRHTVRAALGALAQEGLIRSEHGRGSFVTGKPRLTYPIGRRTRFSAALEAQNVRGRIDLLRSVEVEADATVAEALDLRSGAAVLMLETRALADDTPLSFATHWFEAERFRALPGALRQSGSITQALSACGVPDYVRRGTTLSARRALPNEAVALDLADGGIVMVARAVNTDTGGTPIQLSETRFAADRIEITVEGESSV